MRQLTWAFLSKPPVLPPKMGAGVEGSSVGGDHDFFSFVSVAAATLSLQERQQRKQSFAWLVTWRPATVRLR